MLTKKRDLKDEVVPLCRCGTKLSLLKEQWVCIRCIEGNRASEETVSNFAHALIVPG